MVESHSSNPGSDPVQAARDALEAARDAQAEIGRNLRYDALDVVLYALAVGLTVLAAGLGGATDLTGDRAWIQTATPVAFLGAIALLAVGMYRFRKTNGVFVSGFSPPRSRWVAVGVMIVVGALTFGAAYAGSQGRWSLVALAVLAGAATGVGFSWLWIRVFRAEASAGPRG